jgi:hypothetical protein
MPLTEIEVDVREAVSSAIEICGVTLGRFCQLSGA